MHTCYGGVHTGGYSPSVPNSRSGLGSGSGGARLLLGPLPPSTSSSFVGGGTAGRKRALDGLSALLLSPPPPPADGAADALAAAAAAPAVRLLPTDLTAEQAAVLRDVHAGRNVFYTGGAGSGKSALAALLIHAVRSGPVTRKVAGIAPTGAAAQVLSAGSSTVHSFAGFSTDVTELSAAALESQIRLKNPGAVRRWTEVDCLFIDEISMISAKLLDKVAWLCESPVPRSSAHPPTYPPSAPPDIARPRARPRRTDGRDRAPAPEERLAHGRDPGHSLW
jgi:hypothetical protein